jgi:hypothetical protein
MYIEAKKYMEDFLKKEKESEESLKKEAESTNERQDERLLVLAVEKYNQVQRVNVCRSYSLNIKKMNAIDNQIRKKIDL